jgi:glycosyltransferase involved in cell wall biosynthesis
MITVFTPAFADESDTNAQNLTAKEIVARLDPQNAFVTMFCEGTADARIASRPNTRLLRWRKHGNVRRAIGYLLRKVPDVYFHPREGPLDRVFLSLRRCLGLKSAVVTQVVSGGLYFQPYSRARTRNIREADAVFANNSYLAELVKEKLGVAVGWIYNGIDRRHFFPRQNERRDQASVLYAGSLRPYKRVPLVVREAARWPQVKFRIVGTGEDERACKHLAAELGCTNVEFLGHLSPSKLGEQMRRADIFFFPSITEGHPQVLGQAAASGLPVVAMRIYRPDYVVDGATGFLAESDGDLSQKLGLLIRQVEIRRTMGKAAIRHAMKFDWDLIAKQWQEALELAITKRQEH